MPTARLTEFDWPDFGRPGPTPPFTVAEMQGRIALLQAAMEARGLDRLVIYGDREHAANIHWATGFDPRFEEAFLVVSRDGAPLLAAGNECLPYTAVAPMVAAGLVEVVHCPGLSLVSQPRSVGERIDVALRRAVPKGSRVGTVGWKYWTAGEADDPAAAIEIPSMMVDVLRDQAKDGRVENATDILMHPGYGLRSALTVDGIARIEFANTVAARAFTRMVFALREGMTDYEAVEAARMSGMPQGCHPTFATGARASQGLSGPTGQRIAKGSPISFNICHWGANICRAGWVAEGPDDLPEAARDYFDAFVGPYVAGLSRWFASMRPGVVGGDVWAQVMADLPPDRFGIFLNPGHLIGVDEWVSSPIFEGSDLPLRSGMPMQCDVIPSHPVYGSTRMEDGYIIADAGLVAGIEAQHPDLMTRFRKRQAFMRSLGLDVPEGLLPLSDTCGIVAPFLLSPRRIVTLA